MDVKEIYELELNKWYSHSHDMDDTVTEKGADKYIVFVVGGVCHLYGYNVGYYDISIIN
jgi:hypothetical protein